MNIGAWLLAGSVFPGFNRLIFAGISPCWHGFYVSSMGEAALVFDTPGINMLSLIGKALHPSLLYLNRNHGEKNRSGAGSGPYPNGSGTRAVKGCMP